MTRDDIIRMAREADLLTTTKPNGYQVWIPENLERFADLVAAAEREACAEVCEEIARLYSTEIFPENGTSIDCNSAKMGRVVTRNCAQSIRARGQE